MELLLEPFGYHYMLNAMWVSAMVGGLCAFLSCYLMLKGWSLIGDALSHSIVPGVAGAYMLGLPFALGAFLSGGLAAGSMLLLNQRTRLKEDAIIGLIFSSFFYRLTTLRTPEVMENFMRELDVVTQHTSGLTARIRCFGSQAEHLFARN